MSYQVQPTFESRPACRYKLDVSEVVVGVIHSMALERPQLLAIAKTWAPSLDPFLGHKKKRHNRRQGHAHGPSASARNETGFLEPVPGMLSVVLLASHAATRGGSIFPPHSLIVVNETGDGISSNIGKWNPP